MKNINVMSFWKEFNPLAEKSIKDDFNDVPSNDKSKIIEYLNKGKVILASPSCDVDIITGKRINGSKCILTDGEYKWSGSLVYYVEKYNLQLPKDLEEKILK